MKKIFCLIFSLEILFAWQSFSRPYPAGSPSSAVQRDRAQCLDEELLEKLQISKKNDQIPVFILFAEQARPEDFSLMFGAMPKQEQREKSVAWLKDLSSKIYKDFEAWLNGKGLEKKISLERRFWLVNGIQAKGTPSVIRRLGECPQVGMIYLRTEKPSRMIKKDKKWARLNLRNIPEEEPFKGPFSTQGKEIPWNLRNIRADAVWAQGFTGRGVVIAILDSGVNYSHADLRNNLWINRGEVPENGKDDDENGYVDDYIGWNFAEENQNVGDEFFHGSESAGILVGDGTAGIITGVAPQASLMILKTYSFDTTRQYGSRYLWQAFQYDKWLAFEYAVENGAHVASLSFDYQPSEKPLFAPWRCVLANASHCGLSIVAGAGNSRGWLKPPHQITPPANVPEVIAVGGSDEYGRVDRVSSRGPVTWEDVPLFNDYAMPEGLVKPDVCAPVGRYTLIHWSSDGYKYFTQASGTSLSAPNVAGVVALMLEGDPDLKPDQIKKRLEETCQDMGKPGQDNFSGWGLVDALDAVNYGLYPKVHLAWVRLDDDKDFFVRQGQEFRLHIGLRVSSAALKGAEFLISCLEPELDVKEKKISIEPIQAIKPGHILEVDFPCRVSESLEQSKKVNIDLFVRPDRGRKFHFRFPLYLGPSDLLIVDDDGEGQSEIYVFEALDRCGRAYHHLDLNARPQDLERCLEYKVLVWITGEEFFETLSSDERALLKKFLDQGGRLFLQGDNIGDDIGTSEFYKSYLHAQVVKDRLVGNYWREKPYMIYGKNGDPLSSRLALPVYTYYKQYDLIRPLEGADDPFTGQDKDNYVGFIRYSGPYKLIYTSLGFEAIEDISTRAEIVDRILDWMEK